MKEIVSAFCRAVLIACVLLLSGAASLRAQVVTKILDQGSNDTHVNIVMFSEGYTSAELTSKFPADAQALLNAFFRVVPYNEYKPYFNAYTIAVASNQSGSDHYTPSTSLKNTYFNSAFDSYGIQRLLTIPPNDRDGAYADGRGKIDALLMNYVPDYDLVMVVVNDSTYGGSGGSTCIASTNSSSPEILIHESGHTLGKLGDEYGDPYPGYPDTEEPNTTTQTNRSLIKWNAWIADSTPVPTPDTSAYSSVIGLFEGAHYHYTGWYRPKSNCRMRTLGVAFCEVCTEDLVLSVYRAVRPIDSFLPSNLSVSATSGSSLTFSVVKKAPATHNLAVQWSVDGAPVAGATADQFSPANLTVGGHQVSVAVNDSTPLVRTDSNGALKDSKTWTVQITAPTDPPVITSALTATGTASYAFSYQIAASNAPTSYGASGLPSPLSLNPTTGLISGIPAAADAYSVTLTATNAKGAGTATLNLTVAAGFTTFTSWQSANFTSAELQNSAISGPLADPTQSGITNLMRYALGLPARGPSAAGLPGVALGTVGAARYQTLTYQHIQGTTDVAFTVEVSGDLITWNSGAAYTTEVSRTANAGIETVITSDNTATNVSPGKRFIRLQVTR